MTAYSVPFRSGCVAWPRPRPRRSARGCPTAVSPLSQRAGGRPREPGRLAEGCSPALRGPVPGREPAEFLIDQRQQLLGHTRVAATDPLEDLRLFAHPPRIRIEKRLKINENSFTKHVVIIHLKRPRPRCQDVQPLPYETRRFSFAPLAELIPVEGVGFVSIAPAREPPPPSFPAQPSEPRIEPRKSETRHLPAVIQVVWSPLATENRLVK